MSEQPHGPHDRGTPPVRAYRSEVERIWLTPTIDMHGDPTWICRYCKCAGGHLGGCLAHATFDALAAAPSTPEPGIEWREFVNLVYQLVPDGDVRGAIIGATTRLLAAAPSTPEPGHPHDGYAYEGCKCICCSNVRILNNDRGFEVPDRSKP